MLPRALAIVAVALVLHGRIGVVRARQVAAALRLDHDLDGTIAAPGSAADAPLRVWALGDSAMAGDGIADPDLTLPRLVARMLSDRTGRQVELTQTGVSGARIRDIIDHQLPRISEADVVVVSAGVNDGLGRRPLRAIRRDHLRLASELRATAPDAALVLVGAPDLRHAPGLPAPLSWIVGWLTGRVGRRQADWLDGTDVAVIAMGTPRAGFGPDGFHPGPLATPVIARRVVEAVSDKARQ